MDITWDDEKAESNFKKHGISFEEGAAVIGDPLAQTFLDDSEGEERMVWIGNSPTGKLLLVVTQESEHQVRIISARPPTAKECKDYEEGV